MFWPIVRFAIRLRGRLAYFLNLKSVGVRAIALNEAGEVLLLRHTYRDGWHFPGGEVDRGEHPSEAAVRELIEETGAKPLSEPELVGVFLHKYANADDHVSVYKLKVEAKTPFSSGEIAETRWFPLDQVPQEATPSTKRRVQEMQEQLPPQKYWSDIHPVS